MQLSSYLKRPSTFGGGGRAAGAPVAAGAPPAAASSVLTAAAASAGAAAAAASAPGWAAAAAAGSGGLSLGLGVGPTAMVRFIEPAAGPEGVQRLAEGLGADSLGRCRPWPYFRSTLYMWAAQAPRRSPPPWAEAPCRGSRSSVWPTTPSATQG